ATPAGARACQAKRILRCKLWLTLRAVHHYRWRFVKAANLSISGIVEDAVSVDQFLKQRAVSVVVDGRYTLPNWYDPQGRPRSFACRTSRVSPFRMMVAVPVVGKRGDRLSTYFGDFGRLDGHISDTVAGGFLLDLSISYGEREKLAS